MCHPKRLFIITIISLLVLESSAYGKKTKKTKRPRTEDEETTPQPNVVTYSTFGFNDVGQTYDGFVPSSPDYASYLSNYNQNQNQESSTRLYGPAFPTAMDNNGYGQPPQDQQSFSGPGSEGGEQAALLQYDPNSFNFGNPTNPDNQNQNTQDDPYEQNSDDYNNPVYGTKLGSKNRHRPFSQYTNSTSLFGNSQFNPAEEKFPNFQETPSQQESKPSFGESTSSSFNYFNYAPTFSQANVDEGKPAPSNVATSSVKFSKYVDFTKYKPSYPTELDTKYATATMKPTNNFNSMPNSQNENAYSSSYFHSETENNPIKYKEQYEQDDSERAHQKPAVANYLEFSVNHVDNNPTKSNYKNAKPFAEYKDKFKSKPWNYSADYNNWKNSLNNDDHFSDLKNNSFKRPYKSNTEEATSSSNNVIDLTNYRFPESDYSGFKKLPEYKPEASDSYPSIHSFRYQENLVQQGDNEYYNQLRNLYSTVPTTTTRWGGNLFKPEIGAPSRIRPKRPSFTEDEVVHIPKRHKYHIKNGVKTSEWSAHTRHGPYKAKPLDEWNKEVANRFKNEEDLLGLRNHDTSHPQYLPSFKLTNDVGDEFKKYMSEGDYKSLVEKWRQSYMKSKYFNKESTYRDNEAYGSESRPMHVPIPKPYPIEVPHPVIVPVPQPYPVRVPVPKPVAIPVVKELTVPIEKPVPYPVIKKIPYPVEKLVPVPVEKEVAVPVMKPYAVPVPHVRPVFHHSRPSLEEYEAEMEDEDDYLPRPAEASHRAKKPAKFYNKQPKGTRTRSRRPSHSSSSYHESRDRNRRRSRKPSPPRGDPRPRRRPTPPPSHLEWNYGPKHKYQEYEEDFEHDHNDYFDYCKRGNC